MMQYMARAADQFLGWLGVFLPNLLKGAAILLVGWYLASKARAMLLRAGKRLNWEPTVAEYGGNTMRYALVAVFAISGLKMSGFPVNSLLAAVGISGVIIGLGVRAQIANYFAGVMMLAARPFKRGDLIEFGPPPQVGTVREVCMTFTAVDTLDNVRVVVPNAVMWRNRIYNFSVHDQRAIRIPLTIPYDVNLDWVRDIALDVLKRHAAVSDDPAPTFTTSDVTAADVRGLVVAWSTVSSMNVFGDVITQMRKEFELAGLAVTVPSKDVDLKREE
jgi:small conductance mechanosensitive channel